MKHIITFALLIITSAVSYANIDFDQYFCDSTLRIDYVFEGVAKSDDCEVSVRALHKSQHLGLVEPALCDKLVNR